MPTLQNPGKKNASRNISAILSRRIRDIQSELDDVRDAVTLLHARKANRSKKTRSLAQTRAALGLSPL